MRQPLQARDQRFAALCQRTCNRRYQDEFTYSIIKYVYNMHDGCSADIDRRTGKLGRLKGSVALLSKEHRAHHVKRVLDRGAPFVANGAPHTRTLSDLKFEAHVFDRRGRPTDEITVPLIQRRGKSYGEVRLPGGCMAILVRK